MENASAALAALKGSGQKRVTLPDTNIEVTIRRVAPTDFMGLASLPNLMPQQDAGKSRAERLREAARPTPDKTKVEDWNRQFTLLVVSRGMVDPPVWVDMLETTPDDHIHYSDIAQHMNFLAGEILDFSGMGVADAAPFPTEPDGGEAGQDSQEVREAAP